MIHGDRVRLRHIEKEDLPRFVVWLNDPEISQGLSIHMPLSMVEEENWFEKMLENPSEERSLCIEAKTNDRWQLIGNSGFFSIDWRNRAAEFGLFIGDKAYWDKGYGTEVVNLLLQHGFATLNLHRIFLRVFEDNPRAIRSYEKAGFIHEGRHRQAEYHNGQFHDVLFMSVLRPEWEQGLEE
jgi:RimJ/RimL family protein N-acetyltransferase